MKRHKSFIIALEGIDGAGKHTLATALREHLDNNKSAFSHEGSDIISVELYTFPDYDSLCGKLIRRSLSSDNLDRELVISLFALDRKIQNTGEDGYGIIKIFDRYYQSNLAYNDDIKPYELLSLEKDSYMCDVTFIVDIDPKESFERRPERRDKFEDDLKKLDRARNKYLELSDDFGYVVLDGNKHTTELVEDILIHICYRMNRGLVNIYHEEPQIETYLLDK